MTIQKALQMLQNEFRNYMKTQVLSKVEADNLEIFFIGLPPKDFPDFERIVQRILSGKALEQVSKTEAQESLIPEVYTRS
jgi:hypothetical protein